MLSLSSGTSHGVRQAQRRLVALGLLLVSSLWLNGCDNVACVYGPNGCRTGSGTGLGSGAAAFPERGELILEGSPRVEAFYPSGNEIHPDSPIVLVFSESARKTVLDAVFGAEEEFVYTSTTSVPPAESAAQTNGTPVAD